MKTNLIYSTLVLVDNNYNKKKIYFSLFIFFVNILLLTIKPVFSQNKLSQIVQNCKPSIFSIITYDDNKNPIAYGTGFFIDSKGTGITNYHVLAGASSARIKTMDGNFYKINIIISQNEKMDIIKFSIENEKNKIFPFLKLCPRVRFSNSNSHFNFVVYFIVEHFVFCSVNHFAFPLNQFYFIHLNVKLNSKLFFLIYCKLSKSFLVLFCINQISSK